MMPRAKIGQAPEHAAGRTGRRSRRTCPGSAAKNCSSLSASMPGVGMCAAQAVNGQHGQRKQDPLAQIRNAENVRDGFEKLVHVLLLRSQPRVSRRTVRRLPTAGSDDRSTVPPAASIFSSRGLGKHVRRTRDLPLQLAGAQHLQPVVELLDHAELLAAIGHRTCRPPSCPGGRD